MQSTQGTAVKDLDKADTGDIAFFSNSEGKIVHVGILLNHRQIIHASGKVRIDKVSEKGIIHSESGKQTHTLHSIRRVV
jgi:cell wall-associated NlpC family hydrolase